MHTADAFVLGCMLQLAGVLLDAFVNKTARDRFQYLLQSMPLFVVTNTKVGIIGSREFAMRLVREQELERADAPAGETLQ
jgi:hypothetical protein